MAEPPIAMAFAGPMGTSTARWEMGLKPLDDGHTDTMMWVEVDLPSPLKDRVQRVKAKHYDLTSRLYPAPGYPQQTQRLQTVQALGLRPGNTVVDLACGTGLNFALLQQAVGPGGRIVGVDLTDAMLARAQDRVKANDWGDVSLVQGDAAGFGFPAGLTRSCPPAPCPRCPSAPRSSPTAPRPCPRAGAGLCWTSRFPARRRRG